MWTYNEEVLSQIPDECVGFVYQITNKITGKMYIGKKVFENKKTKYRKRKRNIHYTEESNWKEYTGSNKVLNDEILVQGIDNYSFKILYLCKTRGEMTYLESREIFIRDALLQPSKYYNEWVTCKVSRRHLTKMIEK
jgi:hypothetical protein